MRPNGVSSLSSPRSTVCRQTQAVVASPRQQLVVRGGVIDGNIYTVLSLATRGRAAVAVFMSPSTSVRTAVAPFERAEAFDSGC